MGEFGRGYESEPDEEAESDKGPLKEEIAQLKSECEYVFDTDAGEMMSQLIADSEEFYEVDKKGWENLIAGTRKKLLRVEDDVEKMQDILREAQSQANQELM